MIIKSVLITDGNRGLGLELLKELLSLEDPPDHVFATYQHVQCTRDLEMLQQIYPQLKIFQLQNADEHRYKELVEYVDSYVGEAGLNLLISNTEYCEQEQEKFKVTGSVKVTGSMSVNRVQHHLQTSSSTHVRLIKEFYPLLRRAAEFGNKNKNKFRIKAAIINLTSLLKAHDLFLRQHLSQLPKTGGLHLITQNSAQDITSSGILLTRPHPQPRTLSGMEQVSTEDTENLAAKCLELIRGLEHDYYPDSKIYTSFGIFYSFRSFNPQSML